MAVRFVEPLRVLPGDPEVFVLATVEVSISESTFGN
jgi:hypothetical protein